PGRILFEMGGPEINEALAKQAMRLAQYKLPVKTKFIVKAEDEATTEATKEAAAEPIAVES
ncbi:MAG: 50S ribosomal protein L16, partial [Synechococcaceae bacterium WB7_1B_046]|nr:50S ribosomal protein L16 [Synechococcaceae bacterium WB7_1B_046]